MVINMLFQVIKNDKVKMTTYHEECIPPLDILYLMEEAGYTFKKEGKLYRLPAQRKKKAEAK